MRFSYFLLQSFLILVLHFYILNLSGGTGGQIGMVPFFVIYGIAMQLLVLLFLYLIIGLLCHYKNKIMWIAAAAIIFELAIILLTGESSIMGVFKRGIDRWESMSFLIPNLIATTITLLIARAFKKKNGAILRE
ncbi:MAG: hypothetical protein BGO31_13810 [Bacteroidetes bacterium 43-16]|nr:MAG: hypothetical protein BGO31_13810 [Bacteroidetes bacterium 43-16]